MLALLSSVMHGSCSNSFIKMSKSLNQSHLVHSDMDILDDMGMSKLSENIWVFFLNYSFKFFFSFQTRNTNEDHFDKNQIAFCTSVDSYATTTLMLQKVHKEIIKLINVN